jgi:hypothetical protein
VRRVDKKRVGNPLVEYHEMRCVGRHQNQSIWIYEKNDELWVIVDCLFSLPRAFWIHVFNCAATDLDGYFKVKRPFDKGLFDRAIDYNSEIDCKVHQDRISCLRMAFEGKRDLLSQKGDDVLKKLALALF